MAEEKKQTVAELNAEIARLQKELKVSEEGRSNAEAMALAVAQVDQFVGNTDERPTGKTMTVRKCANPAERDEKKQVWEDVEIPTYYYTIQLPAGAGLCLTTNGVDYYHGETYEFDLYTLVDIKSRVARTWDHEKSIHGDNENAYRKPTTMHYGKPKAARPH